MAPSQSNLHVNSLEFYDHVVPSNSNSVRADGNRYDMRMVKRNGPSCSRNFIDPDGSYSENSDTQSLSSNFSVDRSNRNSTSHYRNHPMTTERVVDNDYQYGFEETSHSRYDGKSSKAYGTYPDSFYGDQQLLRAHHTANVPPVGTNTSIESMYNTGIRTRRHQHRYETTYDDVDRNDDDRPSEYDRNHVVGVTVDDRKKAPTNCSTSALSEYEMRIATKCNASGTNYQSTNSSMTGMLSQYEIRISKECNTTAAIVRTGQQTIEIAPGQHVQLRGAAETWEAVQNDFYLPCSCISCTLTLFCIQDASYVICPICFVVSPLGTMDGYNGGVGLGFTLEELSEWQDEINGTRRGSE